MMDEEETPRIEEDDDATLIVVDTPYLEEEPYNWSSFSHASYTFEASLEEVIASEQAIE